MERRRSEVRSGTLTRSSGPRHFPGASSPDCTALFSWALTTDHRAFIRPVWHGNAHRPDITKPGNKSASVIVSEITAYERIPVKWSPFDTGMDLHRSGTFPSGATPIGGSCSRPANSSLLPGADLRSCRLSCAPKQRMGIWSWFCYRDRLERDESFHHAPHTGGRRRLLVVAPHRAPRATRTDDGDARWNRAFHSYLRYNSGGLTLQCGDSEVVEVRGRRRSLHSVFCSACSFL